MKKLFVALVAAIAAFATFAETYTWLGGSGSFSDATKWQSSSGGVPGDGADLAFPDGSNSVADMGTITLGAISIGAGTTELKAGAGGSQITVNGVVSGEGRLRATATAGQVNYLFLKGENTFSGGLWLDGFRGYTYNNKSFGTGDVYARAVNGTGAQIYFESGTTEIANNIFIGREAQGTVGSIVVNATSVRHTGNITFSNSGDCQDRVTVNENVRFGGSGTLTFAGTVKAPKGVAGIIPTNGKLVFEKAISGSIGSAGISFNGGAGIDLMASDNAISALGWNNWSAANSTLKIFADNPISASYVGDLVVGTGTATGAKTFDLNGHKAAVGGYEATKTDSVITSSAAGGELTINAKANKSYTGKLTGELSVVYNGSGTTWTLTGASSTMNGTLKAQAGTIALGAGAGMTALAKAEIGAGGVIAVDAAANFNANQLVINKDGDVYGQLKLNGKKLSVLALTVDGEAKTAGTYTGTDWLDEGSSVEVIADANDFIWTGAAGDGLLSTAGNWLKGGVIPDAAPTSADTMLFSGNVKISDIGTTTFGAVKIAGDLELDFAVAGGTITFGGAIGGSGSLKIIASAAPGGVVNYNASSTFSGTISTKGVKNYLNVNDGLGTAAITAEAITGVSYPFNTGASVDKVANDITCQYDSNAGTNPVADGWMTTAHDVEFTGKYTIYRVGSGSRYYNWRYSGKTATFKGGFAYSDPNGTSSIVYGGGTLIFHATTGNMNLQYNSGALVVFAGSGAEASTLWWNGWSSAYGTLRFDVDNPFTVGTLPVVRFENLAASQGGGSGGDKIIDLNGHDVTLRTVYNTGAGLNRFVKSDTPATLTLNDNDNHTMRGHFDGALSLVYNSKGHTYTIESGDSSMSGTLRCNAGAIALGDATEFVNLDTIEIAPGAVISASASAKLATRNLVIEELENVRGQLQLNGNKITVLSLTINGEKQPAGTYSGTDWLDAGSSVEVLAISDEAWVWTGAADGKWATLGNWTVAGQVPTAAMPADVEVYIGAASAVKPIIFDVATTIANPITLGVGAQYFQSANTSKVTFTGVIRGSGQFYWQCSAAQCELQLEGVNTFEGGVVRDGRGTVICKNGSALGTGKFVQKYSGNAAALRAVNLAAGTYPNDFTFGAEGGNYGWDGCLVSYGEVHLTGSVRFEGDTRMTGGGADSHLHFDGPVYVKGRLTTNNAAGNYHFHTAVTGGGYLHTDQECGNWYLYAESSGFARAYMGGSAYKYSNYLMPMVDGALAETFYADATAGIRGLDLNGTSQTIDYIADMATSCNGDFVIKSVTAGKLTLKSSKAVTLGAQLDSQASLEYAPKGDYTLTFRKGVGTSEGTLTVSGGTFKLTEGASMLKLSAVDVAAGATLNVDATAGGIAANVLTVADGGTLDVGDGQILKFSTGKFKGESLAVGTYTEGNSTWVKGAGSVKIIYDYTDKYVWTGADDGVYSNPANWLVNGEIPAAAPTSESGALYIMAAGVDNPVIIGADTTIDNELVLGGGTQHIDFSAGATLYLKGKITGDGGLYFNGAKDTPNVIYYANFYNTNNDFAGGVTRAGAGQIQVHGSNVLGTGKVELMPGSANGSKIANATPLYIGTTDESVLPNEFAVHDESYNSWNGWLEGTNNAKVRFTGDVKFAFTFGNRQTRFTGNATVYFDGNVSITGGGLICKSGVKIYFAKAVTGGGSIWGDNGSMDVHFQTAGNDVNIYAWSVSTWNIYLEAEGALAGKSFYVDGTPANITFDLCGLNQSIDRFNFQGDAITKEATGVTVTSETPATFTVTDSTSRQFGGKFAGAVAFTYAAGNDDAVYTLTGKNFVSDGLVTAKRGTIRLTGENSLNRASTLNLDGGKLQLDANQVVRTLQIGGEEQETGTWGAVGSGATHESELITGEGILTVKGVSGVMLLIK